MYSLKHFVALSLFVVFITIIAIALLVFSNNEHLHSISESNSLGEFSGADNSIISPKIGLSVLNNRTTSNSELFFEYKSQYHNSGKKPLAFSLLVSNKSDYTIFKVEVGLDDDLLKANNIQVLREPGSFVDGWIAIEPSKSFAWTFIVLVDETMAEEEVLRLLNKHVCTVSYEVE